MLLVISVIHLRYFYPMAGMVVLTALQKVSEATNFDPVQFSSVQFS